MALVNYLLLCTLIAGLRGSFDSALLSSILIWAVFVVGLDVVVLPVSKILNPNLQARLLEPFELKRLTRIALPKHQLCLLCPWRPLLLRLQICPGQHPHPARQDLEPGR